MKVIQVGDIANVARTLTKGLRAEGVDARLALMPKPADVEESQAGVDIIRTPFRTLTQTVLLSRLFGRYWKFDIFHAHAMYNILLGQIGRLNVSHFHGDDLLELASGDSFLGGLMIKAMHRTGHICVSTPNLLEVLAGFGVDLGKVTFLPNPVEADHFRPKDDIQPHGEDEDTVKLFHPTRFQHKKRNDKLFEAYAELQDRYPLSLYLIENKSFSPAHEEMLALIRKLGLKRVNFLPRLPHRQLVDYYNAADIVLDQFGSPAMGLVSLEALACGKPVVSTYPLQSGSYPEKPPVLSGFTVVEIKESISYLVENRVKWTEIGWRGREWILKNHALPVVIARLLEVYRKVLE